MIRRNYHVTTTDYCSCHFFNHHGRNHFRQNSQYRAAISGAVLLILTHILTIDECVDAVDIETIGILVGMMLLVAVVKNSGIFEYIAIKAAKLAKGRPWPIMVTFVIITAFYQDC